MLSRGSIRESFSNFHSSIHSKIFSLRESQMYWYRWFNSSNIRQILTHRNLNHTSIVLLSCEQVFSVEKEGLKILATLLTQINISREWIVISISLCKICAQIKTAFIVNSYLIQAFCRNVCLEKSTVKSILLDTKVLLLTSAVLREY